MSDQSDADALQNTVSVEDMFQDFLDGLHDAFARMDQGLVALEQAPGDAEILNDVCRAAHSIKGTAAFMNLDDVSELAHHMEDLLDGFRAGGLAADSEMIDVLLEGLDALRAETTHVVEKTGEHVDIAGLHARLDAIGSRLETVERPPAAAAAPTQVEPSETVEEAPAAEPAQPPAAIRSKRATGSATLRVSNDRIDELMNLVGELVIARNRLAQLAQESDESLPSIFRDTVHTISNVSTELHRKITAVRMVPVAELFRTFPRLVRDLSREMEKEVRVELVGENTELDKTLIEAIRDPMIHLIRNSVDHGLEPPDQREQAGKPREGRVRIEARQAQSYVIIEVEDDGRGIDPDRIRESALSKGIISPEQARRMSSDECLRLVFAPGFSTAEKLSDISGRGIGMDLVRENVESLGGNIDIATEIGGGTRFSLKLPLTLAIIPALLVVIEDRKYAMPLSSVVRTVALHVNQIERLRNREMVFLHGQLMPLVSLDQLLFHSENGGAEEWRELPRTGDILHTLVVSLAEKMVGIVVREPQGIEEIVIKPMGPYIGDLEGIMGAAILGDGSVIPVIDPVRLIRATGL